MRIFLIIIQPPNTLILRKTDPPGHWFPPGAGLEKF
jgi:hypothetical protein